jgi:hypothetical protein
MNDLAKSARHLHAGDPVAITGYLHLEPIDTPDGCVCHFEIVAYEIDHQAAPPSGHRYGGRYVIANPALVVLTAHVAQWADDDPMRTAWIIDCLHRHSRGDWGELDPDDNAANSYALRHGDGRVLSRYPIPAELTDPTIEDDAVWIITDDVADPDTFTTVLWPSDY